MTTQADGDRCPGALRLHEAADGLLARIRVPGGLLTADQVEALADAAELLGTGSCSLTARGNVEIRGLTSGDEGRLQQMLVAAELLPSPAHERVRNIVASPCAGLDGRGQAGDLTAAVRALDRLLCSLPRTADLSGRFLFGLDDGRGDVLALHPDIAARWVSPHHAELVLAGAPALVVATSEVPRALVGAALAFLDARDDAGLTSWRLTDAARDDTAGRARLIATIVHRLVAALPEALPVTESPEWQRQQEQAPSPPGPLGAHTAHLLLPLGQAPAATWRVLARATGSGDGLLRATGWRSVLLTGLAENARDDVLDQARHLGLVVDPDDPWRLVSACTGRPGCASSHADVRADVHAAIQHTTPSPEPAADGLPVHVSGCDRRCGHPRRAHHEAVALPEGGYAIRIADGAPATGASTGRTRAPLSSLMRKMSS